MKNYSKCYFTISSLNYVAYVKTLYESIESNDSERVESFFLILVDEPVGDFDFSVFPFKIILARDLNVPEFWDMAFRYSVMELNTAVKPAALLHLMNLGYETVTYLDPDIFVVSPLDGVHAAHADGANVILTPHSTSPLEDGFDPDDLRLMRTGVYNLGFASFRDSEEARSLLEWWHRRMLTDCRVDLARGLFVDQKFMDLAPAYCGRVHILRDKGYNAAYWNLPSRPITRRGGHWFAAEDSLRFFHFSGVVPSDPTIFSKHQNRYSADEIGELSHLLEDYIHKLNANGHQEYSKFSYAYSHYNNGVKIPDIVRRVYGRKFPSQIRTKDEAFEPRCDFLEEPAVELPSGRFPISSLMYQVWLERPDLSTHFSLHDVSGRESFSRWFLHSAQTEYELPDEFYSNTRSALERSNLSRNDRGIFGFSHRNLARRILRENGRMRSLYRKLPARFRMRVRTALLNAASSPPSLSFEDRGADFVSPDFEAGISLFGYLGSVSGVGEGARRMAEVVRTARIKLSTHVIEAYGHVSELIPVPDDEREDGIRYNCLLFHVNADQTPSEFNKLPSQWLKSRYRIGYWAWELSEFPDEWCQAFNYLHEIWVPSQFVKDAIQAKTSKPVHIIPHPVPIMSDSGEKRVNFGLPIDRFLFLCSFDLRSYVSRKNPGAAYEAFCKAFPNQSDADGPMLVVKLHGGSDGSGATRDLVNRLSQDPRVIIMDIPLSSERYAALQKICDAYISLHRSEGFGMNIAECMRLGKPVIATNYSGNTDFLSDQTGFPVRYKLVDVIAGQYPFGEGKVWAEPSVDHAAEVMKLVAENPKVVIERCSRAVEFITNKYSVGRVAENVISRFDDIQRSINVKQEIPNK